MKLFEALSDKDYVRISRVAEMWKVNHIDLLEVLKSRNIIEVELIDVAVNQGRGDIQTGDLEWEGHPKLYGVLRVPLGMAQIKKLIKKKQMSASCITFGKLICTPQFDEAFDLTLDDLYITKKDAVEIAQELGFGEESAPLSLELCIALDCFHTLYENGLPNPLKWKREATNIKKWLEENYTSLNGKKNSNMFNRITMVVNPASNPNVHDIPKRKNQQ